LRLRLHARQREQEKPDHKQTHDNPYPNRREQRNPQAPPARLRPPPTHGLAVFRTPVLPLQSRLVDDLRRKRRRERVSIDALNPLRVRPTARCKVRIVRRVTR
jgi:hypothetical protein